MLAINKRYKSLKVFSAGSLAFAVGLTAAAAYVSSTLTHQNLSFDRAQTVGKTAGVATTKAVDTSASKNATGKTAGASDVQPQASSSWANTPVSSYRASAPTSTSSGATQTVSGTANTVTQPVGGVTNGVTNTGNGVIDTVDRTTDNVTNVVQGTTDNLNVVPLPALP